MKYCKNINIISHCKNHVVDEKMKKKIKEDIEKVLNKECTVKDVTG